MRIDLQKDVKGLGAAGERLAVTSQEGQRLVDKGLAAVVGRKAVLPPLVKEPDEKGAKK